MNRNSQPVPASLLRTNSDILGGISISLPTQSVCYSLVSSRTQFNNANAIGNVPNVSSLLHQSFSNGGPSSGPVNIQQGGNDNGPISDPLSIVGNGISFNSQQSFAHTNLASSGLSAQMQGQQFSDPLDQQQSRQLDARNFQQNHNQFQQISSPQNNFGSTQQIQQAMRTMPPQHSNQSSSFLQQQQSLQMPRSSPQPQLSFLQQQKLLQLHQQQQLGFKSQPLQRSLAQPQFQPQNLHLSSPQKPAYEPGMCARRLTRYTNEQKQRPEDNNIEFWRKFIAEFYAPNAKKKWCVSMYGNGRQTTGVFPQDAWHCEICNRKPGRGFEATVEVLPRLFKIKYDSGTLEELLYVDMPREYQNSAGQIILDYAKAIQESIFDQLRVVRDGQLRVVFSPDLKICSWEFCARRHDELIPRRLLTPQASQLGAAAQKYEASTESQSASSTLSVPEMESSCSMFLASAKQVAKTLEVPLVNDLGYSKRYVRCLQISEVVNSMKDLIDYSRETTTGPMESLVKFARRTITPPPHQLTIVQNSNNNQIAQAPSTNGASPLVAPSPNVTAGQVQQNSMNSIHTYAMTNNSNSPLSNPSLFQPPTPSSSNNAPQNSPNISSIQQQAAQDPDSNDSQSSVQKIINQYMMNSQLNNGANGNLGDDAKNMNQVIPMSNGANSYNGIIRGPIGNNGMTRNTNHQQGFGGPVINGFGNNLQFNWKS